MSINDNIPPNPHPVKPPPNLPPPKQVSQPKRFSHIAIYDVTYRAWDDKEDPKASDDGEFVFYSDYAALAAENTEVKDLHLNARVDLWNLSKENQRLKSENERLRKAGDQMLGTMLWAASKNPDGPAEKRILAWIKARDGNEEAAK